MERAYISLSMHGIQIYLNIPAALIEVLNALDIVFISADFHRSNIEIYLIDSLSVKFRIRDGELKEEYIISKDMMIFRLFVEIEDYFMRKYLLYNESSLAIHGGGVVSNDKAILVLQGKGAGKSTLIAKLSQDNKYKYLSDDLLLLNKNYVAGVYLPIRMRRLRVDGLDLEDRCKITGLDFDRKKRFFYMPDIASEKNEVPISLILIPHYSAHGNTEIVEVKGAEKVSAITNQIKKYHSVEQIYHNVSELVKHTRVFDLYYKDFSHLVALPLYNELL